MNKSGNTPYDHKRRPVRSECAEDGAELKGPAKISGATGPVLSNEISECQTFQHPMLWIQSQIPLVERQVDSSDSTLDVKSQILTQQLKNFAEGIDFRRNSPILDIGNLCLTDPSPDSQ